METTPNQSTTMGPKILSFIIHNHTMSQQNHLNSPKTMEKLLRINDFCQ